MISKILLTPFFGEFPPWFDLFLADFNRTMKPQGYTLMLDVDLPDFKERVKSKLGIDCRIERGSPKAWDYRGSLGILYEEEIKDYDFYGHCDLDVVWGQINKWASDEALSELDVYSSHSEYVCGCFSLYRNSSGVKNLFYNCPTWQMNLISPEPTGWIERDYSRILEVSGLRYKYDLTPQGNPFTDRPILKKEGDRLFQADMTESGGWKEIGLFHFKRSKQNFGWPL